MIQEVLLALSGHPSALCTEHIANTPDASSFVTPAEKTLLVSVGRLGELHRALKSHTQHIRQNHPSVICRAVANTLLSVNLRKFQKHIEHVERNVLLKDASNVGAYNIVPLASIVQEFEGWKKILEWYWDLACFILPVDKPMITSESSLGELCSGPALLDRLRTDMNTGYQDVEEAATQLLIVGEQTLMRIVACWLLTGRLPDVGQEDFFVQQKSRLSDQPAFHVLEKRLIPTSIDSETASSVLFVGKTLKMLEAGQETSTTRAKSAKSVTSSLMTNTMGRLREIKYPIKPALLAAAVATIRKDLAIAIGHTVLPIHSVVKVISHIREFFLAGEPAFTDHLIDEADKYLMQRHQQTRTTTRSGSNNDLAGITMRAPEVRAVLNRTWVAMSSSSITENSLDLEIEWARDHLSLALVQSDELQQDHDHFSVSDRNFELAIFAKFDTFLLSTPVELKLNLEHTYDLFLSRQDRQLYSSIHGYLLAIRRAHTHISRLWRDGALRKVVADRNKSAEGATMLRKREANMRTLWTICSSTVATLSEIGSFFDTEVIKQSWATFRNWALPNETTSRETSEQELSLPHDLETLAAAHKQYLWTLARSLLITDESWTRHMRNLLTYVDSMAAFMARLQIAQRNVELYTGNTDEHIMGKYMREEAFVLDEALKSCRRVEDVIRKLTDRLRHINFNVTSRISPNVSESSFEPWQPGNSGIERLLLRLDMRPGEGLG